MLEPRPLISVVAVSLKPPPPQPAARNASAPTPTAAIAAKRCFLPIFTRWPLFLPGSRTCSQAARQGARGGRGLRERRGELRPRSGERRSEPLLHRGRRQSA